MTRYVLCCLLLAGVSASLGGCLFTEDLSMPQDSLKHQDEARANRAAPGPTELPPGLGNDLPAPATQPLTKP